MIEDPSLRMAAWVAGGLLLLLAILRMRVLDRYVGALWIRSFLVAALTMCGLYLVIDLAEKADALLKTESTSHFRLIVEYYSCRLPLFASRLFPMMCLAATIMTVVSLTKSNELVPMILAGQSVYRVLGPAFLAMGTLVAGAMAVDEWLLPRVALQMQLTESRVGKEKFQERENVFDRENTLWFYDKYNLRTRTMRNLIVDRREPETGRTWHITGAEARWVAGPRSGWLLSDGVEWTLDALGRIEGTAHSFGKDGLLV
ncbi:MAG: LptF/LptG family permease, partial [Planctomycetota bacterium]